MNTLRLNAPISSLKKRFSLFVLLLVCTLSQAQSSPPSYTLQELKEKFTHENYTEEVLLDFQKELEAVRIKPELHEYIPGEVIAWSFVNGSFATMQAYLIESKHLRPVDLLPKDEEFLAKLNSFVPEKSRFTYSSDLWSFPVVFEKRDNGFYVIKVTVTSYSSRPDWPSDDVLTYNVEYLTKDFKAFELLRLKDIHVQEWTVVGK